MCNASAGEYAGFTLIAAGATYLELAIVTLIANARYLLMSCAMSQRLDPGMPGFHRPLMAFHITDELFGIAIARPGCLNPFYSYGVVLVAAPCWAVGTALGAIAGGLLPLRLVSAFSVALYGMFLAVIIPASRTDKIVGGVVTASFLVSFAVSKIPALANLSDSLKISLLTVLISGIAAFLFPAREDAEDCAASDTLSEVTEYDT